MCTLWHLCQSIILPSHKNERWNHPMMHQSTNKIISCTLTAVFMLLLAGFSQPHAQTLKGRAVIHIVPENTRIINIPGVPGDNLILVHFKGLVFLDNGEVAEVMGTETIYRPKESGRYLGYEVLTFKDGSTIMSWQVCSV